MLWKQSTYLTYLHGHASKFVSPLFLDRDVAAILLGRDDWKEMLRSSVEGAPIMRDLIDVMPGKLGLGTHPISMEKI